MINRRRLGKTDLLVSEIGLGCQQLGGETRINDKPIAFGNLDEKTTHEIINTAYELGVNTFDTADYYSLGESEKRLGTAIKEYRSDVNLFTKGGKIPGVSHESVDLSYHYLMSAIDRSLERLQTDYVDLFQTHKPLESQYEYDNVEKAFKEMKAEGKARYCGVSVGVKFDLGIDLINKADFVDSIMIYFSLIDPQPLKQLLQLAKKNGVGVIIAEPLAQGLLTGKYKPGFEFPESDVRYHGYDKNLLQMKLERSQKYEFLINESRTANQVALSYVLSRNEISCCIPGSKSIEQLKSNIVSSDIILTSDELKKIEDIQNEWIV